MTLITTHDTLGSAAPAIGTHVRQFLRTAIGTTIGTPAARAIGTDSWLAHVPVALFASVMGLGGLGLAWRRAHQVLGWPSAIGETVLIAAALAFIAISLLYTVKVFYFGSAVAAEFQHPVRSNFFSAISVALLLLGHAALPYHVGLAEGLWLTGAALHLLLAVIIINRWITHIFEIQQSSSVWFIPVVGNILVPLLGVQLGYTDISWFFFSVGVVFWVILFTVMLYCIIFHDPLPARLLPTLFILMAPPAVGFSGWLHLNRGQLDPLARLLFSTALFIALLLSMAPRFLKLQFYVSCWAYTFPSAGLAIAALTYHQIVQGLGTAVLATVALVIATAIIIAVSVRTVSAIVGGRLFVPD